jgi:hypothetical protein
VIAVSERPVRLTVADDLKRGHGSVFFRIWFAIPFLIWLGLLAIAAFFIAIANWGLTLVLGYSPSPLHRFLERFVRYTTHVYAYFNLAAEPLPSFDGEPGYPIDVEFDPPARQNRWTVAFRLILAIPAMLLVTVLVGSGSNPYSILNSQLGFASAGLVATAAFLGWFVGVILGRMPRGLRDLIAYGLSYGAQAWAYLLLLTGRYPSSDPLTAIGPPPVRDDPVQLEARDELRRSRLTVFFRLLLAVPHLVWLALWGIAALLAAVANWVATLVVGVSPQPLHRFLAAYVRYQLHVGAYVYLVGNPFPGFTGDEKSYPIELRVAGRERQNRWTVLFRLVLAVPALLIAAVYGSLLFVVALLGWFAGLFTGRMPLGLRNAGTLALRYSAQTYGYLYMVTGTYPYSGPCVAPPSAPATPQVPSVPPPVA